MKKQTKSWLIRGGAVLLALVLVVFAGITSNHASLKATNEVAEIAVEEKADEQAAVPPVEITEEAAAIAETEPIIATEEIVISEIEEAEPSEAPEEVVPEEAQTEEITENEPAEGEGIPEAEKEPAERSVRIEYQYEGEICEGLNVTLVSYLSGFENNVKYQWQRSTDGTHWENAPDGNGANYLFILDGTTSAYYWRLLVTEAE